jgi:hypothetical protein
VSNNKAEAAGVPPTPTWPTSTLNGPQATRGTKRRLLRWPARGREMSRLLKAHGIYLCGLQEVGLRTSASLSGAKRWLLTLARPNEKDGPGWQVGNGILAWTVVLERLHKRTYWLWNGRRWLFIPVHLYADRRTGDRTIFIAGHADRKKPDPAPNRKVLRKMAKLGNRLHRLTGCPVEVVLDANNDKAADDIFDAFGGTHLAGGHIDKVYGWGVEGSNRRTLTGFAGIVTDHANPPAVDVTPVTRNFELNRIPRLTKEK